MDVLLRWFQFQKKNVNLRGFVVSIRCNGIKLDLIWFETCVSNIDFGGLISSDTAVKINPKKLRLEWIVCDKIINLLEWHSVGSYGRRAPRANIYFGFWSTDADIHHPC